MSDAVECQKRDKYDIQLQLSARTPNVGAHQLAGSFLYRRNKMNLLIENISKMTVNGNRLELPSGDIFSNYSEVKKALTKAGGKYSKNGFSFDCCADDVKSRLCGGEKIDDKKKFQYFPTPKDLAVDIVDYACIDEGMSVLEPSAGKGAIASLVRKDAKLTLVEINKDNIKDLMLIDGADIHNCDFMDFKSGSFDRIVANPPFTKNQDIDHVMRMYDLLKEGGRLVSVMSKSWVNGSQQKQVAFRKFIDDVNGEFIEVEAGTFKESGTNIATSIVIINK